MNVWLTGRLFVWIFITCDRFTCGCLFFLSFFFWQNVVKVLGFCGLVNEVDQVLDVCLLWFRLLNFVGGGGGELITRK